MLASVSYSCAECEEELVCCGLEGFHGTCGFKLLYMAHLYLVDIPGTADNPHALLDQCPGYSRSNPDRGSGHQGHSAFPPLHLQAAWFLRRSQVDVPPRLYLCYLVRRGCHTSLYRPSVCLSVCLMVNVLRDTAPTACSPGLCSIQENSSEENTTRFSA